MLQPIKFSKMHGLGNDFIVMNAVTQCIDIQKIPIRLLADRHRGIGFDQLLIVTSSQQADFGCRIFNADGSEAEQCGNGMRCIGRFIQEEKLSSKKSLTIETRSGIIKILFYPINNNSLKNNSLKNNIIEAIMNVPCFEPEKIPFLTHKKNKTGCLYKITVPIAPHPLHLNITVLSMGNPHAILHVSTIDDPHIPAIGQAIAQHPLFPKGTNVGFMQIVNPSHIRLRTIERGAGETLACGTNACAAVVAGILNYGLTHKVTVALTHGNLSIQWLGQDTPVSLSGTADFVFNGTVLI